MLAVIQILQGINLIASFIVPTIQDAMKIKSLFTLNPDYTVNVVNLSGAAITADDATIANVDAWRAKHGLPPVTPQS